MNNLRIRRMVLVALWVALACGPLSASPGLKVICASRADKPPVMDGRLDDPCWAKAEVRSDFVTIGVGDPVQLRTAMRFVYDDKNLYMALEFHWDDVETLRKGIRSILAARGRPAAGLTPIEKYENRYGVEVFLDSGASQSNYYQILFNAAGQFTGNYNAIWEKFKKTQTIKAAVGKDRWTVEFAQPAPGLTAGDEWGLNVVRNDDSYYGMWSYIVGAFAQPKRFGRLVIGDYAAWWQAVFAKGAMGRLDEIHRNMAGSKRLRALYKQTRRKADSLARLAAKHRPIGRENFEVLYKAYHGFKASMDRLEAAYQTYQQIRSE